MLGTYGPGYACADDEDAELGHGGGSGGGVVLAGRLGMFCSKSKQQQYYSVLYRNHTKISLIDIPKIRRTRRFQIPSKHSQPTYSHLLYTISISP